jgi:hypothetical protein
MVQVVEELRRHPPAADFRASVERLLGYVPAEYLEGLASVRLKDTVLQKGAGQATREGWVTRGLYWRGARGRDAYIELNVEAIRGSFPRWLMKVGPLRDDLIAHTLFHEVGHHIHTAIAPDPRDREVAANLWRNRLARAYVRRRFWYLRPLKAPVLLLARAGEKLLGAVNRRRRSRRDHGHSGT